MGCSPIFARRHTAEAMPSRSAPALSTLLNEPALIEILDPLVQVVTTLPGARQDREVSVVVAVGGGHDNCPGRRRADARDEAVFGKLGGQTRASATTGTDHQLPPVCDSQLRGHLHRCRATLPPSP